MSDKAKSARRTRTEFSRHLGKTADEISLVGLTRDDIKVVDASDKDALVRSVAMKIGP